MDIVEWIATACSLIGAAFVAGAQPAARRRGFAIWILANAIWIVWAIAEMKWGLMTMFAAYQVFAVWGWRNNRVDCTAAKVPEGHAQPH